MPAGRPSELNEKIIKQAYKLALLGLTDAEMADIWGVSETTVNNWKLAEPKFLESLKKGKVDADADVAASLYERAKGYAHPEEKVFCSDGVITTHTTTKHYPPDTAAAMIWLRNRQGTKWRDKPADNQQTIVIGDVSQMGKDEAFDKLKQVLGDGAQVSEE